MFVVVSLLIILINGVGGKNQFEGLVNDLVAVKHLLVPAVFIVSNNDFIIACFT